MTDKEYNMIKVMFPEMRWRGGNNNDYAIGTRGKISITIQYHRFNTWPTWSCKLYFYEGYRFAKDRRTLNGCLNEAKRCAYKLTTSLHTAYGV